MKSRFIISHFGPFALGIDLVLRFNRVANVVRCESLTVRAVEGKKDHVHPFGEIVGLRLDFIQFGMNMLQYAGRFLAFSECFE